MMIVWDEPKREANLAKHGIDAAPDNPELTAEDIAKAVPFAEAFPKLAATMRTTRGPQKAPTKISTTIRLDREVLERFKATGPGWQSRINDALREASTGLPA